MTATLLAVDLGLTGGLALYARDGTLSQVRSFHFAKMAQLKRALPRLLAGCGELEHVFIEGDRHLGDVWTKAAERRGAAVQRVSPETWRAVILKAKDRTAGSVRAKQMAERKARRVIDTLSTRKPTSLRVDAAEAVLIGLYGVLQVGWLDELPRGLR